MITLPELLKDPKYREFFMTVPKDWAPKPGHKPWRLYVQREADGPWAKKDYASYAEAYRRLAVELKSGRLHDGAIQSRGVAYAPPTRIAKVTKNGKPVYQVGSNGNRVQKTVITRWKPKLDPADEAHTWCTYCRRPTVFRWFRSHHALRGLEGIFDPSSLRCIICGAREAFVRSTLGTARTPQYDPRQTSAAGRRKARR